MVSVSVLACATGDLRQSRVAVKLCVYLHGHTQTIDGVDQTLMCNGKGVGRGWQEKKRKSLRRRKCTTKGRGADLYILRHDEDDRWPHIARPLVRRFAAAF